MDQTDEAIAIALVRRMHQMLAEDAPPLVGTGPVPRGWIGDAEGGNGLLVCWRGLDILRGDQLTTPVGVVPAEILSQLRLLYGQWSYSYSPADYPALVVRSLIHALRSIWPNATVCTPDAMRPIGHHDQMDLPDFIRDDVVPVPSWRYVIELADAHRRVILPPEAIDTVSGTR